MLTSEENRDIIKVPYQGVGGLYMVRVQIFPRIMAYPDTPSDAPHA
jgi:hypothetical protein